MQRPASAVNVIFANGCKLPKRLRDPQDRAATETSLHIKIRQGAQPPVRPLQGSLDPCLIFAKHRLIYDMPRDQTLLKACMEVRKLCHKYGTRCDPHSFDPRLHQNCPHRRYHSVHIQQNIGKISPCLGFIQEAPASCGGGAGGAAPCGADSPPWMDEERDCSPSSAGADLPTSSEMHTDPEEQKDLTFHLTITPEDNHDDFEYFFNDVSEFQQIFSHGHVTQIVSDGEAGNKVAVGERVFFVEACAAPAACATAKETAFPCNPVPFQQVRHMPHLQHRFLCVSVVNVGI